MLTKVPFRKIHLDLFTVGRGEAYVPSHSCEVGGQLSAGDSLPPPCESQTQLRWSVFVAGIYPSHRLGLSVKRKHSSLKTRASRVFG